MIVRQPTVVFPTTEFEINISDRSFVTNATYQTDAQSKFPLKYNRRLLDDHTTNWKVETSSSEAKIVRIGAGSFKIFQSWPEKGTNGLSFFPLEGKIEQRI